MPANIPFTTPYTHSISLVMRIIVRDVSTISTRVSLAICVNCFLTVIPLVYATGYSAG
jgi:hypothetical protein